MTLYAAKLKANAKPVVDQVDKKEASKLKRQEASRIKKEAKQKEEEELARQEEEARNALMEKENELKRAEEAKALKKQEKREQRRMARLAKKDESVATTTTTTVSNESTVTEEKPIKSRKRKSAMDKEIDLAVATLPKKVKEDEEEQPEEPPAWFKKYVSGVKNEESQLREKPKPKKEIAKESEQVANEQWGNGLVRDRVRNEVDQHMNRMYQMIFNRRGF
jgi:hypothetical protein